MNRRNLLQLLGSVALSPGSAPTHVPVPQSVLVTPQEFGAKADGEHLDTAAINAAIEKVASSGGGVVYFSPGVYLSGTVMLRSRITLYLEAGAVLRGSERVSDYAPQPGPNANSDAGQRHLIFGRDLEDVTLCGPGCIDGQGPKFWESSNRLPVPKEDHWKDVATYDFKPKARVSPMLELVACRRLRIEQLRIENSSGWTLRLINCNEVVVDGVSIKNPIYGPNVDGIDISNSSNVRIANCMIDTADDAICLKSEVHNPYSEENIVTRNITVTNCILTCCCNGFKFGTAGHGGFENIVFSNSVIFNDEVDYAKRVISGIAIEVVDGGWAEGVVITGIRMQRTRTPIFIRVGNRTPRANGHAGTIRGVMISDVHATGAILTSSITGVPGFPVEDVTLSNIHIQTDEDGKKGWVSAAVPEEVAAYPEARMFGRLPASGIYLRHAEGIVLRNLHIESSQREERPTIFAEDVSRLEVDGLRVVTSAKNTSPAIYLRNTSDAWIRSGRCPAGAQSFLHLEGRACENIVLSGNDLRSVDQPVSISDGGSVSVVEMSGSNILRNK